ncbi:MAG: PEGA domain-containing protein [Paludibacteraceae bacterium]|nr:PEGA domain-containing protein [Paludibacteraceae bacterium]
MLSRLRQILFLLSGLLLCCLPAVSSGWISVRTSVGGCEVVVDTADIFAVNGRQITLSAMRGLHTVMVSKDGYRPYIDTVTVADGVNHWLNVWLEPVDEKYIRRCSDFRRTGWDYQVNNGAFEMRWFALGAGLGTGATVHASLFDMRVGLLAIEPCMWGFNAPFYNDCSHVRTPWVVRPHDRFIMDSYYEMAIPSQNIQFFYTPMVGVHLPVFSNFAVVLSAGPQISWTHITWSYQLRELPISYGYVFSKEDFPENGFHFDPVWFTLQLGALFKGEHSDLMAYARYQDGFFVGLEMRF